MIELNPRGTATRAASQKRQHPALQEFLFAMRRLFKNPLTIIGLSIVMFFVLVAVFAPIIAPPADPANPYMIPHDGWRNTPSPPSLEHPFGTLQRQYDIFYGMVWGTRNAFRTGLIIVFANLLIGIVLGAIAGYFGGIIDEVVMRITDVFYAMPMLPLAMALVVALGRGMASIIVVLIIVGWPTYTRVIRSEILVIRNMDYIQAAKASGASSWRILLTHVFSNSMFSVIIIGSMRVGTVVLSAAALSFLGLGAEAGYADWGQIVSGSRNWIVGPPDNRLAYWYVVFIPGFVIALFVLGWNLLGDAVRDVFDPRVRRK